MTELSVKLAAAFEAECQDHLKELRISLGRLCADSGLVDAGELDDAFRRAHSLKGAARIVGATEVERIAHRLEGFFAEARDGVARFDKDGLAVIQTALDAIEDCATCLTEEGTDQPSAPPTGALDPEFEGGTPGPAPAAAAPAARFDTVRLSADSLDRLLQSSGELLTEALKQDAIGRELNAMRRQIADIEREWEVLDKSRPAVVPNRNARSDSNQIKRCTELIGHQLHALSRQVRSARLMQQRAAWSLRLLGDRLQQDLRRTRMVPVESVFQGFRKMMRDLARDEGKPIDFSVVGSDMRADRAVLQALKDPLMHVLRNAVCHGIETENERHNKGKPAIASVLLKTETVGNRLVITVEDDGRGIDLGQTARTAVERGLLTEEEAAAAPAHELVRLLFQPGFSTAKKITKLSGRGIGLSVVQQAVARLQGEVDLRPREEHGTVLLLNVPLALTVHRLVLASCRGQVFAIPTNGIEGLHRVRSQDIQTVEGKPMVALRGHLTALATLDRLLGMESSGECLESPTISLLVLRSERKRLAVAVDGFQAERDALIKNLGKPAGSIKKFSGGILLEDGTVALVLNPAQLLRDFQPVCQSAPPPPARSRECRTAATILVVDDSFTTRTLETSILEAHGYQVRVAVDGVEALGTLRAEKVDLVITDIQMPRLDGFGLLEEIKNDERLARIPVIIVSSVNEGQDQERGLRLGADAYIVKRKFDHQELLQTIEQIL